MCRPTPRSPARPSLPFVLIFCDWLCLYLDQSVSLNPRGTFLSRIPTQDAPPRVRPGFPGNATNSHIAASSSSVAYWPFIPCLPRPLPRRLRTRRAFAASRPRRFPLGLAASKPPLCRGHTCPPRTEPPSGPFSSADAACSCSCRCPSSVVFADEGRLQLDRATIIASMQNLG